MSEESILHGSDNDVSETGAVDNPSPSGEGQSKGAAGGAWYDGLPDDLKGLAEVKGWKDPADALKSYKNLEEFMGADKAGRGLILPKDENDRQAFDKIYERLGRPEKAEDYALADFLKENGDNQLEEDETYDENMLNAMSGIFHEAGLSKKQGQSLAMGYNKFFQGMVEAQREKHRAEVEEVKGSLAPEQLETARRGFRFLGLSGEDAVAIEAYLGVKKATDLFTKIGVSLAEDKLPADAKYAGGDGSISGAQRLIQEKRNDGFFMERYLGGDKSAKAEMDALYAKAYPDNE